MRIIETNIPDISKTNINESKVNLANSIIKDIHPLFDELLQEKVLTTTELQNKLETTRKEVLEKKKNLETLFTTQKRKQKVKKLLDRIEKMVNTGIVSQGNMRSETVVLLRVIDNLQDDKIDYHLKNTMNIITKRVGN